MAEIMAQGSSQAANAKTSIHPDTQVGAVALAVADLAGSQSFYQDVMGFTVIQHDKEGVVLGAAGVPLLVLREQTGARPAPANSTGLYHFAVLLPTRADLAQWLLHLVETGYPLGGASDHLVSEALYLSDPEGNGIEVYRDRPRAEWPHQNGQVRMATDPLDLHALVAEARANTHTWQGLPAGTHMGHIHLQVADIPQARDFYSGALGFDVMVDMSNMGALFVSAGGYHHHIGLNIWHSRRGRPAPEGSTGLRHFTVQLSDEGALAEVLARLDASSIPYTKRQDGIAVEDPWHNTVVLEIRG